MKTNKTEDHSLVQRAVFCLDSSSFVFFVLFVVRVPPWLFAFGTEAATNFRLMTASRHS
jgi:hypothetical protein